MADQNLHEGRAPTRRRYRWPWFLLAALLAALGLAVIWLSFEVERTRRLRDLNAPAPAAQP